MKVEDPVAMVRDLFASLYQTHKHQYRWPFCVYIVIDQPCVKSIKIEAGYWLSSFWHLHQQSRSRNKQNSKKPVSSHREMSKILAFGSCFLDFSRVIKCPSCFGTVDTQLRCLRLVFSTFSSFSQMLVVFYLSEYTA